MTTGRAIARLSLVLLFSGMAVCARAPDGGPEWRIGFVVLALAAGALVITAWMRGNTSTREVLLVAVILRCMLFPLQPSLSDDGYRYVWDGMIQTQEGVNPYEFTPDDPVLGHLHGEAVFRQMNSEAYFSIYPPLSQIVFAVGGTLYPLGWEASWYLIKLLILAAEMGGVFLLSRMLSPRHLLLYAWHPLVVVEVAGQAHTEGIVAGLLVLAVWAYQRQQRLVVGGAVAAAGWVKLVPFFLAPFLLRRMRWTAALACLVVAGLLVIPYSRPFVVPHVLESLNLYVRFFEFNAGPYFALKQGASLAGLGDSSKVLGPGLQWLFFASLPVLVAVDWKRRWSVAKVLVVTLAAFSVFSTTTHPWYLVPLLALAPLTMGSHRGLWFGLAWWMLGLASMATYLLYVGYVDAYWMAVTAGWLVWSGLVLVAGSSAVLPRIMKRRAANKWRRIRTALESPVGPSSRILDLGAGEGYVGQEASDETGACVTLADVVDFNQTELPMTVYDGCRLPFATKSFDLTMIVFALHHAENAEVVLREAVRVSAGSLVVIESVYGRRWQRVLLTVLDRLANSVRSGGRMKDHLHFRTDAEWRALFEHHSLNLRNASIQGRWIHLQAMYVLVSED